MGKVIGVISSIIFLGMVILPGCGGESDCNSTDCTGGQATGGAQGAGGIQVDGGCDTEDCAGDDVDWDLLDTASGLRLDGLAGDYSDNGSHPELDSGPSLYSYSSKRKIPGQARNDSYFSEAAQPASYASSSAPPAVTETSAIFVDSVLGDDANPGTLSAPIVSLQRAVNMAARDGKVVLVAGGPGRSYGPFWAHDEVYCGYGPGFGDRDPETYPSVISGGSERRWGVAIGRERSALLDGCSIRGGDASWEATLGVAVFGRAVLNRNRIDGGSGSLRAHGVVSTTLGSCSVDMASNIVEVFGSPTTAAGGVVNGGCDATLLNNTIVVEATTRYARAFAAWPYATSSVLVNNIMKAGTAATYPRVAHLSLPATISLIGNALISARPGPLVNLYGGPGVRNRQIYIASMMNRCEYWPDACVATGGNITVDSEEYIFAGPDDYRLGPGPATDAGADPIAYDPYGLAATDYAGLPRPDNGAPDIGAYEGEFAEYGNVVQVTSRFNHSCALLTDGKVNCWGKNIYGALGSNVFQTSTPAEIPGLGSGVAMIDTGYVHSCALLEDGSVRCWGMNPDGVLGNETFVDSAIPVEVLGLGGAATRITVQSETSCALMSTGGVKCWGADSHGQLGNSGSNTNENTAVDVVGLTHSVDYLESGGANVCAILSTGALKCWGLNNYGQLGDGGLNQDQSSPIQVIGLESGVMYVTGGLYHTCALLDTGAVKCWGYDAYGQLGDGGTNTNKNVPVDVVGLSSGVKKVAAGYYHTCAVMVDGSAKCWGLNSNGQLGDGYTTDATTPVDVQGLSDTVADITLGQYHTCVLLTNGTVECWGYNLYSQLGYDRYKEETFVSDVYGVSSGVVKLSMHAGRNCALLNNSGVKCWGGDISDDNDEGLPKYVPGLTSGVQNIFEGHGGNYALLDDGSVKRFTSKGVYDFTVFEAEPLNMDRGWFHTCAVLANGKAQCWGQNSVGQLGDGNGLDSDIPVTVNLTGNIVQVAASSYFSYALLDNGEVYWWGNGFGAPQKYDWLPSDIVDISAGSEHACAMTSSGSIECWRWGDKEYGQAGGGYRGSPPGVYSAMKASDYRTCAIEIGTGAEKCWGKGINGQEKTFKPTVVAGLFTGVTAITYNCSILSFGEAVCWGGNQWGTMGIRDNILYSLEPLHLYGLY